MKNLSSQQKRCSWCTDSKIYQDYHDNEWGVPVHDDRLLFEMLSLELCQAGLSWLTILQKRQNFKDAFDNFEPEKIAKYTDSDICSLMKNDGIVRNKPKIRSIIKNSKVFLEIQEKYGSFDKYIWKFVNNTPIVNKPKTRQTVSQNDLSDLISKDLKKKGMVFLGPVIIYSYLQAIGIINDHEDGCFLSQDLSMAA